MRKSSEKDFFHNQIFYEPDNPRTIINEQNKLKAFNIAKITNLTKLVNVNAQKVIKQYKIKNLDELLITKEDLIIAGDTCFKEFDNLFRDIINNIIIIKTLAYKRKAQKYAWITFDNEVRFLAIKYNQIEDEQLLKSHWFNLLSSYNEKIIKKIKLKNVSKTVENQLQENIKLSLSNLYFLEKIIHEIYKRGKRESIQLYPGLEYIMTKITAFYSKTEQWVDEIEIIDETVIYRKVKLSDVKKQLELTTLKNSLNTLLKDHTPITK